MRRTLLFSLAFSALVFIPYTHAHEGEIDSCGGHLNKQTNEYHIHEYKKYRACNKREKATEQAQKKMIYKCGNKTTCEEMANCKATLNKIFANFDRLNH